MSVVWRGPEDRQRFKAIHRRIKYELWQTFWRTEFWPFAGLLFGLFVGGGSLLALLDGSFKDFPVAVIAAAILSPLMPLSDFNKRQSFQAYSMAMKEYVDTASPEEQERVERQRLINLKKGEWWLDWNDRQELKRLKAKYEAKESEQSLS